MSKLLQRLLAPGCENKFARFNATIGTVAVMGIAGYAGLYVGFQGSTLMYGIGAAGPGIKSVWRPILYTVSGGFALGCVGMASGTLAYPLIYGSSNLLLVAFPSLQWRIESKLPTFILPKVLVRRTSAIVSAMLLAFDVFYLREIGLIRSFPESVQSWSEFVRRQE
jgi:hypothetical protein